MKAYQLIIENENSLILFLDNEVELKAMIDEEIALLEKQLETLSKQLIYAIVQETEFDLFNKCQMEFSP